jgi:hypothetical protein
MPTVADAIGLEERDIDECPPPEPERACHMIPRPIARRMRPMWVAAVASAAWANRDDLNRWVGFARRAVGQRGKRPVTDVVTEARVRAAISADPLLRRDPSLKDLTVHDGVVTLLTSGTAWPDPRIRLRRLEQVKGISDVAWRPVDSQPVNGAA